MFRLFKKPDDHLAIRAAQIEESNTHRVNGNAFLAKGNLDAAASCYRQAIAANTDQIEARTNLGYVLIEQQQLHEAAIVLEQALALDATNTDILYMLAVVARNQNRLEDAIVFSRRVLALRPDFEPVYSTLSELLIAREDNDEARTLIQQGIARYPKLAHLHFLKGTLHVKARDYGTAILSFQTALSIQPDQIDLHHHLAMGWQAQGELEKALACYARILELDPDNISALVNRSAAYHKLKRHTEALADCDQVLEREPDSPASLINRGAALNGLMRYEESLASYERAMLLQPDDSDLLTNRGNVLKRLNRHEGALSSFVEALRISPLHASANLNASLARLQIGEFKEGWRQYEWRWQDAQLAKLKPEYAQPLWLGEHPLHGKTILLHAEQGLGDTIQFCRYAKAVSDLGAVVIVLVPKVLETLLQGLEGAHKVLASGQILPPFDYHCPLMSLPLALAGFIHDIPSPAFYLTPSSELIDDLRQTLSKNKRFKVGICWKGSAVYQNDLERSPGIGPFSQFLAQFIGDKVSFYTLMPGTRDEFIAIGGEDLGHEIDQHTAPFAETASLMHNLDLVITSDTSIAHLAGALGRSVWLVLPFCADWRWLVNREDTPWYPRTRLFRQAAAGDWAELFERVSVRLAHVLENQVDPVWPVGQMEA